MCHSRHRHVIIRVYGGAQHSMGVVRHPSREGYDWSGNGHGHGRVAFVQRIVKVEWDGVQHIWEHGG